MCIVSSVRLPRACTESEEEAQVWSVSQQPVDSCRHPPVSLVDQLSAEVVVDLARDRNVGPRPDVAAVSRGRR